MHNTEKVMEKAILVYVNEDNSSFSVESSLEELGSLVKTAGGEVVSSMVQNLGRANNKFYIGTGKIEELKGLIEEYGVDLVVCNTELTRMQFKNLEEQLQVKVLDKTFIILDIFAKRALSSEGKVQVELAMLNYKKSKLVGGYTSLSKQGGGIGSKGPGEKKLETDRRLISSRIYDLEKKLSEIEKHRETMKGSRSNVVVAMVGYTNAGKSTLMNCLSEEEFLAEDMLFATLDTTTRKVMLNSKQGIHLVDTVGFIEGLPHHLIKAFKSTLYETINADIILHVIDGSSEDASNQIEVVEDTLCNLGISKPIIEVYNKSDLLEMDEERIIGGKCCRVSAKDGVGIERLKERILGVLQEAKKRLEVLIPYEDSKKLSYIYDNCEVLEESHEERGVRMVILGDNEAENRFTGYIE